MENKRTHIDIWVDEIVPCLRDAKTGEEKETVACRVYQKDLKGYNTRSDWYVNWHTMPVDVEIYALYVKGETEIQGLVGVRNDKDNSAAYICWGCVAPHNNKQKIDTPKYIGAGGHLFAIAADVSVRWGYGGYMYGIASNNSLANHYVEHYGAERGGFYGKNQVNFNEGTAKKIMEEYTYEWYDI
jgi:hypothetical protein